MKKVNKKNPSAQCSTLKSKSKDPPLAANIFAVVFLVILFIIFYTIFNIKIAICMIIAVMIILYFIGLHLIEEKKALVKSKSKSKDPSDKFSFMTLSEPGDMVRHKSGGPAMYIEYITDAHLVHCSYFSAKKGEHVHVGFHVKVLYKTEK